jgi:hypothetical protein
MSAKYTFKVNNEEKYLNIPLNLTTSNLGQEDLIESDFVEVEANKAINGIVDYEKVRLKPVQDSNDIVRVDYKLHFKDDDGETTLKTAGFTNDDIRFKRNSFKKSFLNLMFFDTDIPTRQNMLDNMTIYNKLTRFDVGEAYDPNDIARAVLDNINNDYNPNPFEPYIEGFANITNSSSNTTNNDIITGTSDSSIGETLLVGQKCNSFGYGYSSKAKYYVDKLSYKVKYETTNRGGSCLTSDTFKIGTKMNASEVKDTGIPYTMFETVYLVDSDYKYNNQSYKLYVKWMYNFYENSNEYVNGVYFIKNSVDKDNDLEVTPETQTGYVLGTPKDVGDIPLRFIVENPIKIPRGFSEGYYIYHQRVDLPNSIYMRANYNNAKTGTSTDLVTIDHPEPVEILINKLHTKYNLKIDGDTYYYELDTTYSDNIIVDGDRIIINLYEIQVL